MKKIIALSVIYYAGISAIFLSVLAIALSILGLLSQYIGISAFSMILFQMSVIMFSCAMSLITYLNIYFLHKEMTNLKEDVVVTPPTEK